MRNGIRQFLLIMMMLSLFPAFARATDGRAFDLDTLLRIIDEHRLSRLEEVLPLLPEELRSSFTLQYESHGLQGASFEHPRAILFGKDARFVLSFNGHPEQRKFNSFEIFQFDDNQARFEFYSLDFPIRRDLNGNAIRPERNPRVCLNCHGTDPHPRWGSYAQWPGIFGANDDCLTAQEREKLLAFRENMPASPRYAHLRPMLGSEVSPFREQCRQNFQFRPNDRLNILFNHLNAKRLGRLIQDSPNFRKYLLLLVASIECSFWTDDFNNGWWEWSAADQAALDAVLIPDLRQAHGGTVPFPDRRVQSLWNLVYLFGTSLQDWNMAITPNAGEGPTYFDGISFLDSHIFNAVWPVFRQMYPQFEPQYRATRFTQLLDNPRLVQTEFDREFVLGTDEISFGAYLSAPWPTTCVDLIDAVKRAYLRTP